MFDKATFVVRDQASQETIRDRLRVWLEDRPWVKRVKVPTLFVSSPKVQAETELESTFSGIGCAINIALAVITFGVWAVVAALYYLYRAIAEPGSIDFEIYSDDAGNARLKVELALIKRSSAARYLDEIEAYLSSEFSAEKLAEA